MSQLLTKHEQQQLFVNDYKRMPDLIGLIMNATKGQPSDYIEDSDAGNELVGWIHERWEQMSERDV